jgi:predicted Zn-dependent peptidase
MFLHSRFDLAEIEKERGVIKEELAMYLDQPHHLVQELLNETIWPEHPLGRSLTGTEKTIDAMQRADLMGYQRANYVAANTLVVVAGDLRQEHVVKALGRYLREFPKGRKPRFTPAGRDQQAPRMRLHSKDTAQTNLALGLRTCSRHDERRFALRLLNTLLGENMSSRLFQALREDRGLAYSVHSSLSYFEDTGALVISAGLDTDKLPHALKLIMRELRRFIDAPPSAVELRRARDYLVGQIDLGLETTEHHMMWLGEHLISYGKIIQPSEIKDRLCQVKPAQVREAARQFLRPERLSLALVSPLKSDAGLRELLRP